MKTPKHILEADIAKLLWFDAEQLDRNLYRIPLPVKVKDGVPYWDSAEIFAWRRSGCMRLRWWYRDKSQAIHERNLRILAELAATQLVGGAAQ